PELLLLAAPLSQQPHLVLPLTPPWLRSPELLPLAAPLSRQAHLVPPLNPPRLSWLQRCRARKLRMRCCQRCSFCASPTRPKSELSSQSHCISFLPVQTYGSLQTSAPSLLITDHPLR